MIVVVNDTNIFIDLYKTRLLDAFFQLPFEFHTVDFVIHEIQDKEQKSAINQHIKEKRLFVKGFMLQELVQIQQVQQQAGHQLSFTDCAVWKYADENGFVLLTGDGNLRRHAQEAGTPVHGLVFVFDQLVMQSIISRKEAANKAVELLQINSRLPKKLFLGRINQWRSDDLNDSVKPLSVNMI